MSDEEDGEMSAEAFYDKVIPSAWIGMLDLCHDLMMRLGDFLEAQGKMVEEAKAHMRHPSTQEEAEIIPFPTDNEGEQSE
jgi:hypothetical protein|tara:strand:+ start:75 stop:314 length:240 start_codon:yes stop_codon:yes gene_type:complete